MIFSEDGIRKLIIDMIEKNKKISDKALELGISEEYLKKVIRDEGFRYSKKLGIFYHESNIKDINEYEVKNRLFTLLFKRYFGIDIDEYEGDLDYFEELHMVRTNINLPIGLYNELAKESNLKEVDFSHIISEKLLDQLEKNRETTSKKMKNKYLELINRHLCDIDEEMTIDRAVKIMKSIIQETNLGLTYKDIFKDMSMYLKEFFKYIGYSTEELLKISANEDGEIMKQHYNVQIKSKVFLSYEEVELEL